MHQKWNIRHDHATRFFDGITSFSSMLHSFLTAFRKTIYQTIYQTITNKIKNPFLRQKESLRNHFRERKTVSLIPQHYYKIFFLST